MRSRTRGGCASFRLPQHAHSRGVLGLTSVDLLVRSVFDRFCPLVATAKRTCACRCLSDEVGPAHSSGNFAARARVIKQPKGFLQCQEDMAVREADKYGGAAIAAISLC